MAKIEPTGKKKDTTDYEAKIRIPERIAKNSHVVTYSEMSTYRQCPLKHHWAYKERWRKDPAEGSPLSRGTLWHEVLECHYEQLRRGVRDLDQLMQFALDHLLVDASGRQSEDQELIEWMYRGYLDNYGVDPDWQVLAVESAGQVRLPSETKTPSRYWLRFKIDLLVRERKTGKVVLVDHKSARDFTRPTEIDIDDQFGLYTWALRQLGVPVHAVVRSDARTQRNKGPMSMEQRFQRIPTYRTDAELEHIALDAARVARAAWGKSAGTDLPFSSPDPRQCGWKCDFLQPHILVRKGMDPQRVLTDYGFYQSDIKHREYLPNPAVDQIAP